MRPDPTVLSHTKGLDPMPDWLAAETEWNREHLAAEGLAGRGHKFYQPKFRQRKIVRGRKVWLERFLLGRWTLVELLADWARQYNDILSIRGIRRILLANERPLVARQSEVDKLRNSEERGFVPVAKVQQFKPGDRVWVDTGPFAGYSAQFEGEDDVGDPTVLVAFLGALTPLSLTAGSISPA